DDDWIGNNNWDNLENYPLKAYMYYYVVETATHWFIGFSSFHPRDWHETLFDRHENDLEGVLLTIQKDGSTYGKFLCMNTVYHLNFRSYMDMHSPPSSGVTNGHEDIDGDIEWETVGSHSHPIVYVEAKGHGILGEKRWEDTGFPGGDGIIYRPTGTAEEPSSGTDDDVGYALIHIKEIWNRRFGPFGDGYMFERFGVFDGNDGADDSANAPWNWDDHDDGPSFNGEFFYDPANLVDFYFEGLGSFSHDYTYNPYAIKLRVDELKVNWDKDSGSDISDPYFNLYMFDGGGNKREVLDFDSGSQWSWCEYDLEPGVWVEMHSRIPRPLYGMRYPNYPYFGINCKEADPGTDDWLMENEYTHWYGPKGIPHYEGRPVSVKGNGQSHYDWVGSEAYITLNIEPQVGGFFYQEWLNLPVWAWFAIGGGVVVTVIVIVVVVVKKK
ncbi:MAG: hypothetical protein ACFFDI_29545, partial [Promethearchaeota archaeon]